MVVVGKLLNSVGMIQSFVYDFFSSYLWETARELRTEGKRLLWNWYMNALILQTVVVD